MSASDKPEYLSRKVITSNDDSNETSETEYLSEDVLNSRLNRELRKKYAKNVFRFLVCYCVCVLLLMFLHGFGVCNFELPDSVLVTIAGSTAVSAIGLVGIVTKGLFGKQ